MKTKKLETTTFLLALFILVNAHTANALDINTNGTVFINNKVLEVNYKDLNYTTNEEKVTKGNAINIFSGNNTIKNNGMIIGSTELKGGTDPNHASIMLYPSGNGISDFGIQSEISTIDNSGLISGSVKVTGGQSASAFSYTFGSGNGVSLNSREVRSTIDNVINIGIIQGKIFQKSGLQATSTLYSTESHNSGNGIGIYNISINSTLGINTFNNSGTVKGEAVLQGGENFAAVAYSVASGNGVSLSLINGEAYLNDVKNNGMILGKALLTGGTSATSNVLSNANWSGNGISIIGSSVSSENKTNNFENMGLISGDISANGGKQETGTTHINGSGITGYSGNGLNMYQSAAFKEIKNNGIIKGTQFIKTTEGDVTEVHSFGSGNGIQSYGHEGNGNLINEGLISGKSTSISGRTGITSSTIFNSGNGVSIEASDEIITFNTGVISGSIEVTEILPNSYSEIDFSGTGLMQANISTINNSGVIKGSQSAIAATTINSSNNHGILAGREIYSDGKEMIKNGSSEIQKEIQKDLNTIVPTNESNTGIYIKLKSEMNGSHTTGKVELDVNGKPIIVSISNGTGGLVTLTDGSQKTVLNGTTLGTVAGANTSIVTGDSHLLATHLINPGNNLIINGAGIDKGALVIDKNLTLINSIVNGYDTAVYLEGTNKLTATDTIFNGGGLKNDISVIKGDLGDNDITLLGNSIINGSLDLGDGNDTLLLGNTTQINGTLNGGLGNGDLLNLGQVSTAKTTTNLNILHNVSGFETINTNGDVTLFETVKVVDTDNINLESGSLTLRVDPTIVDTEGKTIGHALYGNTGTLNSTGGSLVIGLNGLGENAVVSMGGTTITQNTNDSWWKDSDHLTTNSLVLDAKLSTDGKDVTIKVKESLPLGPGTPVVPGIPTPPVVNDSELYNKLNEVYKSIVSAGEIGVLANTTLLETGKGDSYLETIYGITGAAANKSLGELLVILDQMYANNPYSYTLKASRDSMKIFEDNLSYLTIKPNEKEWLVQGRAIYTGVRSENGAYGKNYYGFDTGHRNYKTTTKTLGGLATFEYGLSNDASIGFALGGNNQDIKFRGSSDIEGNSLYVGIFGKKEIKNFKFMGGVGYQYSSLDTEREVFNTKDYLKTSDKYDVNGLSTFIEGKYVLDAGDSLKIEPKVRLSYYHVAQDGIDEGYSTNNLEMSVDKIEQDSLDFEVGVDFVKTANLKSGKLNGILTLSAINTFGDKDKTLTGRINGRNKTGTDFEIQGTKLESLSGKVGINLEYEQINGIIYSVGTDFEFSQNNNRNVSGKIGIGYRF